MNRSVTSSQSFFQQYVMQDSVDHFLSALFELMKTRPYRDITVSELCHTVDLSRNTFYKYFRNKDDLLVRFSERLWIAFQETRPLPTDLSSGFLHYFEFCYSLKELVEVLIRNDLLQSVARGAEQVIRCVQPSEADGGTDPASLNLIYHFISSGCVRLVEDWCQTGFTETPACMAQIATGVVEGTFARTWAPGAEVRDAAPAR